MSDDPALNRARGTRDQFNRAAAGEQKKADELHARQEAQRSTPNTGPDRTTSFAKTVDPAELDRAHSAKEQFTKAASGEQKTVDKLQSQQQQAKRHAPAPQPQLRPNNALARDVDRKIFNERQAKEVERVNALYERLKSRDSQDKSREHEQARGTDRDHSR